MNRYDYDRQMLRYNQGIAHGKKKLVELKNELLNTDDLNVRAMKRMMIVQVNSRIRTFEQKRYKFRVLHKYSSEGKQDKTEMISPPNLPEL